MADIFHRPRRLRRTENVRALVRQTRLAPEDFILPRFACAGEKVRREIPSMPGVHNLSVDEIANEAAAAAQLGVKGVMLFGLPETGGNECALEEFWLLLKFFQGRLVRRVQHS